MLPLRRKTKRNYTKDEDDDFYASIENGNENGKEIDVNGDELEESDDENDAVEEEDDNDEEENPLITDLVSENKKDKMKSVANAWFNKVWN